MKIKLWIDDVRPVPDGYTGCKTVDEAKWRIWFAETSDTDEIILIDIDHDAGDFAVQGGDYIKLLDWLERTGRSYPIRIHSMNPVGVANMRAIIKKNRWTEVF